MPGLLAHTYRAALRAGSLLLPLRSRLRIKRTALFRSLVAFVRARTRMKCAHVNGYMMHLGPKDSLLISINGTLNPVATRELRRHVRRGDVVVDVGANIGYYTLLFAGLAGPEGKVYAFEPEPENFALLLRNVEANGLANVVLERRAVNDRTGEAELWLHESNAGGHSLTPRGGGKGTKRERTAGHVRVETVALDDYFRGRQERIDLVKLDIEGAESRAICGMTDVLRGNRSIEIMTEFNPSALRFHGVEPAEYLGLLQEYGFSFRDLDERKRAVIPASVPELLATYDAGVPDSTNLLCTRG